MPPPKSCCRGTRKLLATIAEGDARSTSQTCRAMPQMVNKIRGIVERGRMMLYAMKNISSLHPLIPFLASTSTLVLPTPARKGVSARGVSGQKPLPISVDFRSADAI